MSATSVPDRPWLAWRARGDGSGPVAAGAEDLARKRQRKEEKRLAEATHRIAGVNQEKFAALGRLYGGLRVLALLFGGLVVLVGLSTIFGGVRP